MFGLGHTEIIIILVLLFLVFGARRLPALGRGIGSGLRQFKDALTGVDAEPLPPAQVAQLREGPDTAKADQRS